jgi:hypothetical protein
MVNKAVLAGRKNQKKNIRTKKINATSFDLSRWICVARKRNREQVVRLGCGMLCWICAANNGRAAIFFPFFID